MRWMARVLTTMLATGNLGCATTEVQDKSGNPEVRGKSDAEAKLGAKVRVLGEATNAKLSAAVEADGWVVYLVDMRAWPDAIEGKRVEATGILGLNDAMTKEGTPDATGTTEPVHVLRDAVYLVLDD